MRTSPSEMSPSKNAAVFLTARCIDIVWTGSVSSGTAMRLKSLSQIVTEKSRHWLMIGVQAERSSEMTISLAIV